VAGLFKWDDNGLPNIADLHRSDHIYIYIYIYIEIILNYFKEMCGCFILFYFIFIVSSSSCFLYFPKRGRERGGIKAWTTL
jgi:hypothetical protein